MSWGFLFTAFTKADALAEVDRQYYHTPVFQQPPEDALDSVKAAIRLLPDAHTTWGTMIYVDASGHISETSAGSRLDIRLITVARRG